MNVLRHGEADRSLLRWGGLAGTLGGVLFLFVFVFVGAVVGPDPAGPAGPVTRFPEIRAARTLENSLYLAVMALWAIHFLALYRALRGPSLASALSGSLLGIAGLTILAAGALPHVATSRLPALYHAPGATPQDQATDPRGAEARALARRLHEAGHRTALVNTTVSGLFLETLVEQGIECVALIHELSGDILLSGARAIIQGVAPNDDFHHGLALQLRERMPAMYKDFRHYCQTKHPKSGELWTWMSSDGCYIVNLFTQDAAYDHGSKPGHASLSHVNHTLHALRTFAQKEKVGSPALPRLSCGINGLDWNDVKPLIEKHLGDLGIPIYIYTNYQKGVKASEPK